MEPKRLYKSHTNKVVAGICGGMGEYFNVDPVFIRIVWLVVIVCSGFIPGLLAYIIAIFIIPRRIITVSTAAKESES